MVSREINIPPQLQVIRQLHITTQGIPHGRAITEIFEAIMSSTLSPFEVKILPPGISQSVGAVVERSRPPNQHATSAGSLLEPAGALVVRHAVVEEAVDDVVKVVYCILAGVEGYVALRLHFADAFGDVRHCDLYLSRGCCASSVALRLKPGIVRHRPPGYCVVSARTLRDSPGGWRSS